MPVASGDIDFYLEVVAPGIVPVTHSDVTGIVPTLLRMVVE